MGAGQQLFEQIESAIRESQVFIAVVTGDYHSSKNCNKEIALADSLGKPIIPVLFEPVNWPPQGLGMYKIYKINAFFNPM